MELSSFSPRRDSCQSWPRVSWEERQEVGRELGLRSTSGGHRSGRPHRAPVWPHHGDHVCWKVEREAGMEPPSHAEHSCCGGAVTWGKRSRGDSCLVGASVLRPRPCGGAHPGDGSCSCPIFEAPQMASQSLGRDSALCWLIIQQISHVTKFYTPSSLFLEGH